MSFHTIFVMILVAILSSYYTHRSQIANQEKQVNTCDHVQIPSFRISTTTIGVIVSKNKILDSGPDTIAPMILDLTLLLLLLCILFSHT